MFLKVKGADSLYSAVYVIDKISYLMHYSVRMPSRKSPQIGVSLNERLLKRFLLSTDSFIVFYLSVNEQLQKTIRKERCKYCCILHECVARD